MRDDVVSMLIGLIAETTQLHSYTSQQMFRALRTDIAQQPLCQVACWCIGEYGDSLMTSSPEDDEPIQVRDTVES